MILAPSYATLRLGDLTISLSTLGGASALVIGVMLIVIGVSVWIRPQFRFPAGIAAGLLALVSLPAANLGGLIVGMVLGLIGAALAMSWSEHSRAHALLLVALIAGTALAAAAHPASGTSRANQAPTPAEDDTAESCLPPEPDRGQAPTAGGPLLAVQPVRLDASRVDLRQVDLGRSNKIVSVRTRQGSKRVLKFVAGAVEVTDLRQTTSDDGGAVSLSTPIGSKARLGGPITLYLEKLCGSLGTAPLGVGFGVPGALLPPISAASPPPFVFPDVTFTDVTVYTAGLFGTRFDVPSLLLVAGA